MEIVEQESSLICYYCGKLKSSPTISFVEQVDYGMGINCALTLCKGCAETVRDRLDEFVKK